MNYYIKYNNLDNKSFTKRYNQFLTNIRQKDNQENNSDNDDYFINQYFINIDNSKKVFKIFSISIDTYNRSSIVTNFNNITNTYILITEIYIVNNK